MKSQQSVLEDSLKKFLIELPWRIGYKNFSLIHDVVFKGLYHAATLESLYLTELYPHMSLEELALLENYLFIHPDNLFEGEPFYRAKDSTTSQTRYYHEKGHACGHSFEKSEPVYQCDQCGYDNTCVLCVQCYNPDDHEGHDVRMYFSSGSNSGICDCGDVEAFKVALNCRTQISTDDDGDNNNGSAKKQIAEYEDWQLALKATIRIALDYFLDVLNGSVQKLPAMRNFVNDGHEEYGRTVSDISTLSSEKYGGGIDKNSHDLWYLVLWNDEHHDYTQATRTIRAASDRGHEKAKQLANTIDQIGYAVVNESSNYGKLVAQKAIAEPDGLVMTIVSARDFMREQICRSILEWIVEVTHHKNATFSNYAKKYLAELLLESPTPKLRSTLNTGMGIGKKLLYRNGMLYGDKFLNLTPTTAEVVDPSLNNTIKKYGSVIREDLNNLTYSRLQYFLAFQIRLSKKPRKLLNKAFIPVLISDPISKQMFCDQFVELYPLLLSTLAYSDIEEELNVTWDILIQVFTCPKSVLSIYKKNNVGVIIGPLAELIKNASSKWDFDIGHDIFINREQSMKKPQVDKPIIRAIKVGLQAIENLVDKLLDISMSKAFFEQHNLVFTLNYLLLFQEYWPLVRKWGEHVEIEVFDANVHAHYSLRVLRFVQQLVDSKTDDIELVKKAVSLIIDVLNDRNVPYLAPEIVEFKVSKEKVSFIHPIHSMLSLILEYYGIQNFISMFHKISKIYDILLRSIVLMSQIKVGFWIRNGTTVSYHAEAYVSYLKDLAYLRDVHLCQTALLVDNPAVVFLNIMERWELLDWYVNKKSYLETTYEDKFFYIAEKLVHFFYNLFANKDCFKGFSPKERQANLSKKMILYTLAGDPQSFSRLKHIMPLDDGDDLDSALLEYGDYHEPTGLTDSGKYLLKTKYLKELDPMSLYLDCTRHNDFDSISESLRKYYATKQGGIKEEKVILEPRLDFIEDSDINTRLGAFTRTKEFAKFIYKLLQLSIDNSNESYLPQLLHLIHAILIDDENINGKDHICEHYISIPICDLLLIIVESNMARTIIEKADYLVGILMKCNEVVENLVDCFGETHIVEYKKRKLEAMETNQEKRKRIAEQKKAKIMKKFAKQQQKFLSNANATSAAADTATEGVDDENETDNDHHCVFCSEPQSTGEPFGLMATISTASIFWKVPTDDNDRIRLAFEDFDNQNDIVREDQQLFGIGYNYLNGTKSYLNNQKVKGEVISICGHGLHYKCYIDHFNRSSFIVCPLCSCLHNFFIPTFVPPPRGAMILEEELNYPPIATRYNELLVDSGTLKSGKLMYNMIHGKYDSLSSRSELKDYKNFSHAFFKKATFRSYTRGNSQRDKAFNNLMNMTITLANTVRMAEITTRLEEEEGLYSFLDLIPTTTKTLLKSLIQFRAFAAEKIFDNETSEGLLFQIQDFWDGDVVDADVDDYHLDGVFNEVIVLFFQTDESWHTLKLVGYVKYLTIILTALLRRFLSFRGQYELICDHNKDMDTLDSGSRDFTSLRYLVRLILDSDYFQEAPRLAHYDDNEFWNRLYLAIERLMLPLLRQYVIFEDSLTTVYRGGSEHERLDKFSSLKSNMYSSTVRPDSIMELTKVLDLSTLSELMDKISNNYDTSFESKIFKVVLEAKLSRYEASGILTLEYPGVIRLIDIPKDYSKWINMYSETWNLLETKRDPEFYICLHCGHKMSQKELVKHSSVCVVPCVLFFPIQNTLFIDVRNSMGPLSECYAIPAPYLTKHGEVKSNSLSEKAYLNDYRYKYLSKLFLNQGLYALVSRGLFHMRGNNQVPVDLVDDFSDNWDEGSLDDDNDDDEAYVNQFLQ